MNMSNAGAPRTTINTEPLKEKSLLGSSYSYADIGQVSTQTTAELADSDDD